MTTGKAMRRILNELDNLYEEYDLFASDDGTIQVSNISYPFNTYGYIEDGHFYDY